MSPAKKQNPRSRGAQLARSARHSSATDKTRDRKGEGRRSQKRGAESRPRTNETPTRSTRPLRVGFIPGVEPDVFARRWRTVAQRPQLELIPLEHLDQGTALRDGRVDMVFARLPLDPSAAAGSSTPEEADVHVVTLWEEKAVAVMGIDHDLTVLDALTESDLEGVHEFPPERAGDEKERVETVASGVGFTRMPMSLARLHRRKDVTYRPLTGHVGTNIGLVWLVESDDTVTQEFVAVVRGRTARSAR